MSDSGVSSRAMYIHNRMFNELDEETGNDTPEYKSLKNVIHVHLAPGVIAGCSNVSDLLRKLEDKNIFKLGQYAELKHIFREAGLHTHVKIVERCERNLLDIQESADKQRDDNTNSNPGAIVATGWKTGGTERKYRSGMAMCSICFKSQLSTSGDCVCQMCIGTKQNVTKSVSKRLNDNADSLISTSMKRVRTLEAKQFLQSRYALDKKGTSPTERTSGGPTSPSLPRVADPPVHRAAAATETVTEQPTGLRWTGDTDSPRNDKDDDKSRRVASKMYENVSDRRTTANQMSINVYKLDPATLGGYERQPHKITTEDSTELLTATLQMDEIPSDAVKHICGHDGGVFTYDGSDTEILVPFGAVKETETVEIVQRTICNVHMYRTKFNLTSDQDFVSPIIDLSYQKGFDRFEKQITIILPVCRIVRTEDVQMYCYRDGAVVRIPARDSKLEQATFFVVDGKVIRISTWEFSKFYACTCSTKNEELKLKAYIYAKTRQTHSCDLRVYLCDERHSMPDFSNALDQEEGKSNFHRIHHGQINLLDVTLLTDTISAEFHSSTWIEDGGPGNSSHTSAKENIVGELVDCHRGPQELGTWSLIRENQDDIVKSNLKIVHQQGEQMARSTFNIWVVSIGYKELFPYPPKNNFRLVPCQIKIPRAQ